MKILKLNLPSPPKPTANCVVTTQKMPVQTSTQFQTKPIRIPVQHSVATTQKTAVQTSSNRVATTQQTVQTALTTTGRVAAETLQTLPENVRAEARERLKFLQYIQQQKMLEPRTPDPMIVAKVAAARVEEFPILRQSGQKGASQLTYNNYRNWQRRLNEYRSTPGAVPAKAICTHWLPTTNAAVRSIKPLTASPHTATVSSGWTSTPRTSTRTNLI